MSVLAYFIQLLWLIHDKSQITHLLSIYKNLGANEIACLNSVDCNLEVSNFGLYKHRKRQND